MLKDIDKHFVSTRTVDIVNYVYRKNERYRKLTPIIIELINNIRKVIPQENKSLLEDLDDYKGMREGILYKEIYRQGLTDGLRLGNIASCRVKIKRRYHLKVRE